MSEQVRLPEFFDLFAKNTVFLTIQEYPSPRNEKLTITWQYPPPPIEIWPELGMLSFDYPRIPPPRPHWNLARTWHVEFWLPKNTTPPPLKFGQNFVISVLTTQEYPPHRILARTWDFEFWLAKNACPPPNWNLARTWHSELWITKKTPPKLLQLGVCRD